MRAFPLLYFVAFLWFSAVFSPCHAATAHDARWFQARAELRKNMEAFRKGEKADQIVRAKKAADTLAKLIAAAGKARCAGQDNDLRQLVDGMKRLDPDLAENLQASLAALPAEPVESDRKTLSNWKSLFQDRRNVLLAPTRKLTEDACQACVPDVVHRTVRQYLGFWPDCDLLLTNMGKTKVRGVWYGPRSAELAKAGAVWDLKLGWISANEKDRPRYNNGEFFDLQTKKWTTLDEANRLHSELTNPWIIQTEHLELRGTAPLTVLVQVATQLELFYDQIFAAYASFFVGGKQKTNAGDLKLILGMGTYPRLVVMVFKDKAQYHAALPEAPSWSAGLFNPNKGSSYFFAVGPLISYDVMFHEFTHQTLHQYTGGNSAPVWLVEGIAVYTQSPAWIDGDLVLGRLSSNLRLLGWTREHAAGKVMSPTALMGLTTTAAWGAGEVDQHYSAAGALTSFCMEAEERRYRADFVDFLRDSYRGSTNNHTIWEYLGFTHDAFLATFETWAKAQHQIKYVPPGNPFDQ